MDANRGKETEEKAVIVKLETEAVMGKMEELCTMILQQEAYRELRKMIDEFVADEKAVEQYERFTNKHQALREKEHQNMKLTQAEIDDYERDERELYDNPVIRRFLYAQREFSHLHHLLSQYFMKTVEFGRLPAPDELKNEGCGCGGNCGCGAGY